MTANQIRLLEHKERERHNYIEEQENERSHRADEQKKLVGNIFGKPGVIGTTINAVRSLTKGVI